MIAKINKLVMTVATVLFMVAIQSTAFAATDHSGFGQDLFTNQAPSGLQDPAYVSANADQAAAAVAAIEPAAGDATVTPPPSAKPSAKDAAASHKISQ